MSTPHTPGPWEISRHATPEHSPQFGVYAEGQQRDLATVKGDNAKADAHLIAAAPTLLDALLGIVHLNQYHADAPFASDVLKLANTAIAKATA